MEVAKIKCDNIYVCNLTAMCFCDAIILHKMFMFQIKINLTQSFTNFVLY